MIHPNRPLAAIVLAVASTFAQAEEAAFDFAIPAQPLSQVLDALSRQTGLQPFYAEETVRDLKSGGVSGHLAVKDALAQALAGTGLIFQFTGEKSVAIKLAATKSGNADELPAIKVVAEDAGWATGYSVGVTSVATKTATPIERIPQSVVVVPRALFEDQGATTLADAIQNVSNVKSFDQRDVSLNSTFKIRGFDSGMTVDGVAAPGYFSNQEPLINAEQIDVVKGPAGSLYGAAQSLGPGGNNVGGVIGITSKAPEKVAHRTVGIRAASYRDQAVSFDFNQPLNEQFGIRLVGETQRNNSETDNVTSKRTFIAPSLAWRPTAGSELVLRLRQTDNSFQDFYGLPAAGTVLPGAVIPRNRNFQSTGVPDSKIKLDGINLQWHQELSEIWSWALTLAQTHAFADQRTLYPWNLFGMNDAYPTRMWDDIKSTTVSPSATAKFEAAGAKHTVIAGLDVERTTDNAFMVLSMAGLTVPNYINPVYPAWIEPVSVGPTQHNTYRTEAVYVQDQLSVGKLSVQAGLRHARISVNDNNTDVFFLHNTQTNNSRTSPRIGAVYELTDSVSAFAGYGESIKVPVGSVYATPPKPEEAQQTEVGFRLKDFNGLSATLAWFDLTRKNVTVPGTGGLAVQVGKQASRGVDLDLVWKASRELSWIASYSNQSATIVENFNNANVGKKLFAVPDTTARIAARYDIHQGELAGAGFGLGIKHQSRLPGNSANTFYTPEATLLDAQASYSMKGARFDLTVSNLMDKKYFVPSSGNISIVYPALRRSIGLSANFDL